MKHQFNRRDFIKATAAGAAIGALSCNGGRIGPASESQKLQLEVAGYDYDRVRAIRDGRVGIDGVEIRFSVENIYSASRSAFGPARTYQITELGLIPYIRKYVNEDYRAYTAIPVFLSRTFRHRNIFVHADSGIEKPEQFNLHT